MTVVLVQSVKLVEQQTVNAEKGNKKLFHLLTSQKSVFTKNVTRPDAFSKHQLTTEIKLEEHFQVRKDMTNK